MAGIAEMMQCPSIVLEDRNQAVPTLTVNQKNYLECGDMSYILALPDQKTVDQQMIEASLCGPIEPKVAYQALKGKPEGTFLITDSPIDKDYKKLYYAGSQGTESLVIDIKTNPLVMYRQLLKYPLKITPNAT